MLRPFVLPAAVALPLIPAPVAAGAFLLGEGEGQTIVTSRFAGAAVDFDASGKVKPLPSYRKFELTALAEYGVTRDLTMILQSSIEVFRGHGVGDKRESGLGLSQAGARLRLADLGDATISAQAVALLPGSADLAAPDATQRPGADVRLMAGKSFTAFGMSGFVSAEAGYRALAGGLGEWRAEATLGLRPHAKWLALAQAYFASARRDAYGRSDIRRLKTDLSAVYRLTPRWSLQAGYGATLYGRHSPREAGPFAAVWTRF